MSDLIYITAPLYHMKVRTMHMVERRFINLSHNTVNNILSINSYI